MAVFLKLKYLYIERYDKYYFNYKLIIYIMQIIS